MGTKKIKIISAIMLSLFISFLATAEEKTATSTVTTNTPEVAADKASAADIKAKPDEKSAELNQPTYFLCKSNGAVRTIRSEKKGSISRVFYTKEGVDKVVCKSAEGAVCQELVNRIKNNLEAGNWKCRDISQTRVSSSID